MKNLETLSLVELDAREMQEIEGGKDLPYAEYTWSGTDNPIRYTGEAVANGFKLAYNGVAALWNWATH